MMNWRTLGALIAGAWLASPHCVSASDPIVLPHYTVSADIIAKMIPCAQLAAIRQDAAAFTTFRLDEVTLAKAPESLFSKPIKFLVRDRNGTVVKDITNDRLTVKVDPGWKEGYLSSNQPAEFSIFYLLLRPRYEGANISIGYCRKLLQEYATFSGNRLEEARRHYGADRLAVGTLRWCTVPDLILIVFKSQDVAEDVARAAGLKPDGRTLKLEPADLDRLVAQRGPAWPLARAEDIEHLTPWGALAPAPEFRDQAALFRVGWVTFSRDAIDRAQDLISVGMWFAQ